MSGSSGDARLRIGRVSVYLHHGAWYVYHRGDRGEVVRRRIGSSRAQAEVEASLLNARLVAADAGLLVSSTAGGADNPTPLNAVSGPEHAAASSAGAVLTIDELRERFLAHHRDVLESAMATVRRYTAATAHLIEFSQAAGLTDPCGLDLNQFIGHLRRIEVAPNGHPHAARRPLRDKGVRYILQTCRAMYRFGQRHNHLPAGWTNPFSAFGLEKLRVRDAKPIFVFNEDQELAFFQAADPWSLAIHFCLAKTGLRTGELTHLLIEDVDLDDAWLTVRGKPELGWTVKTGRERRVPLVDEAVAVLRRVIGHRRSGPVFLRQRFDAGRDDALRGNRAALVKVVEERAERERTRQGRALTRREHEAICQGVWRDAGAVPEDRVRASFIRTARAAGLDATCPKSWRHTFATLLQQASVDVLVRQETMGHKPASAAMSALGMTSVYTHTTPAFQRQEITRAVGLRQASLELARQFAPRSFPQLRASSEPSPRTARREDQISTA